MWQPARLLRTAGLSLHNLCALNLQVTIQGCWRLPVTCYAMHHAWLPVGIITVIALSARSALQLLVKSAMKLFKLPSWFVN